MKNELDYDQTCQEKCLLDANESYNNDVCRVDMISKQLLGGLQLAVVRNGLFIDLLRKKIEKKEKYNKRTEQLLIETVAETRVDMDTNGEHVVSALSEATNQLTQCADKLRNYVWGCSHEEMTALEKGNLRLAAIATMRHDKFDRIQTDIRLALNQLNCKLNKNEQIKCQSIGANQQQCELQKQSHC